MSKPLLIAMVGLPRSGKSTIGKEISKRLGIPIVNRDCMRLAIHGQRYASAAEDLIKALDKYFIKSLFLAGHDMVLCDETNFSRAARKHIQDDMWSTVFYRVPTEKETCFERAIATDQDDLIPIIREMNRRWEDFEAGDVVVNNHDELEVIFEMRRAYNKDEGEKEKASQE